MGGLCILCVVCVREGVGEERGERERGREGLCTGVWLGRGGEREEGDAGYDLDACC